MNTVTRRTVQLGAAALLAVAMMAADSPGCGTVHSDRPSSDKQVDPQRLRTAVITVTDATGPADVWVRANKVGQPLSDHSREQIAGPGYTQTLDYTSGVRIEIVVTVTGNKDDIFACEIADGALNKVKERRAGQVQCKLTTGR